MPSTAQIFLNSIQFLDNLAKLYVGANPLPS